jgi:hypothetical protein
MFNDSNSEFVMNKENLMFLALGVLIGALLVFSVYKINYSNNTTDKRMIELREPAEMNEMHPQPLFKDFYIQPLIDVEVKPEIQITC